MKNKVLSLFLILSLIMSFFSFPAAINAEDYSFTQIIQEYEISGSTLFVTAKISNSGSVKLSVNGYVAAYSSAGDLKGAASVSASNSTTVIYEIKNYTYASGDYVKAFLWDDNFSPMADCITTPIVKGEEIEGVVLETSLSDPGYEEGNNTVTIFVTHSNASSYVAGTTYKFAAEDANATSYLGYTVIAHVGKDDNGNDTIFGISEKSNANTLVTIDTDLILEFDDYSITYYKSETAKSTTEADIHTYVSANNATYETDEQFIVFNGFNNSGYFGSELFETWDYLDEITFLDNDSDGAFEFIFATGATSDAIEFVVETVEVDEEGYYIAGEVSDIYLEPSDPEIYIRVIKDGIVSTVDSILPGDTITCLDSAINVLTLYVSSTSFEGTIEEVADDIYYIGGTPYTLSPISFDWENALMVGNEGVFYINAFGKIAYVTTHAPDIEYLYITDTTKSAGNFEEDQYLVKGITESGSEKVFAIQSKKVDVYLEEDYAEENISAKDAYFSVEGYVGLIGITLSDKGEISAFYFPDAVDSFVSDDRYSDDAEAQVRTYNETRGTYGIINLTADTLIFNVNTSDETVRTSTVGELFVHGSSYSFIAYGEYDGVSDVLVTFDIEMPDDEVEDTEPVVGESEYVFITAVDVTEGVFNDDTFLVQAITLNGETKIFTIKSENVDVYTEDGVEAALTAEEVYEILCEYYGIAKIALTEDGSIADFYLEGSEGFSYDATYADDAEHKTSRYNQTSGTYGTVSLKPDTVIFNINTYDEEICASTVAKAFVNGSSYSFISYGQSASAPEVLVTYDVETLLTDDVEPVIGESEYVFITGSSSEAGTFGEEAYLVQAVTTSGEVKVYKINSKKVNIYTDDGVESDLADYEAFDFIYHYYDIVKIALTEDGSIAAFYFPGCEEFTLNDQYSEDTDYESEAYNAESCTYGTVSIDNETVLYNLDTSEDDLANGISVSNAVDTLQDGSSYSFIAYGKEGDNADVIVVFDLRVAFDAEAPVMAVTRVSEVIADNEVTLKITGVTAGETVSVIVDPTEGWDTYVEEGNIIMYTISEGYASDVRLLFDSTEEEPGFVSEYLDDILAYEFSNESVTIHYGEITDTATKSITIDEDNFYFTYDFNIIVVDYTGATTTIEVGDYSDLKPSVKYSKTAFVKTIANAEDEISDIVVFIAE